MKLISTFELKPIPTRRFDCTVVDDNYDGASHTAIVGSGATEQEAVDDYWDQLIQDMELAE